MQIMDKALELADAIEDWEYEIGTQFSKKVATMLRQQEQTIERYHQILRDKDAEIQWLKEHIEDRESAIYATGYYKGIEYKRLKDLSEDKESFVLHTFTCDCGNYWNLDKYPPKLIEKASKK